MTTAPQDTHDGEPTGTLIVDFRDGNRTRVGNITYGEANRLFDCLRNISSGEVANHFVAIRRLESFVAINLAGVLTIHFDLNGIERGESFAQARIDAATEILKDARRSHIGRVIAALDALRGGGAS
ncbi:MULTISPECIES: hypothetical protein [Paracoccus]|uniref:hypothetical protein n=1 Tax=Paracoccus TaxID=265 RepID=UPI00258910C9|nr:hypothetical protein [Paracoccus sp. (in: a-proteobacteria)]